VAFSAIWDSIYVRYYNAISEINHLVRIWRELGEVDDFEYQRDRILQLLQEVKNTAERALAELETEKEKVEVVGKEVG
jgi:alpha-glucuronidase